MPVTMRTWRFRVRPWHRDPFHGTMTTSTSKEFETTVTNSDLGPQTAQRMLEAQWGAGGQVDVTFLGEVR